jgi:hypothetical protein
MRYRKNFTNLDDHLFQFANLDEISEKVHRSTVKFTQNHLSVVASEFSQSSS